MSNYWLVQHLAKTDPDIVPEPTPKEQQAQEGYRRFYCLSCSREIPVQMNLVPVNIDGRIAMRIVGFSIPSPCIWCGEPAVREIAVTTEPPSGPVQTPAGGIWTPGRN